MGGLIAAFAFVLLLGAGFSCMWKRRRNSGLRTEKSNWMKPELASSVTDELASSRDKGGDNIGTNNDLPATTRVPSELIADHGISELPVYPRIS